MACQGRCGVFDPVMVGDLGLVVLWDVSLPSKVVVDLLVCRLSCRKCWKDIDRHHDNLF